MYNPAIDRMLRTKGWWSHAVFVAVLVLQALPAAPGDPLLLLDLEGRPVAPLAVDAAVRVFVFVRTDCPIANRYAPEIRRLHQAFASRGVVFWLVYPDADESVEAIRAHLKDYDYPMAALRDPRHALVELSGATVTPEVAVFSAEGRQLYRGRIDDRFVAFGETRATATSHDLERALEAALGGRAVEPATLPAVGCFIPPLR